MTMETNNAGDLRLLKAAKEDYLYNFSLALNKPLIGPHMLQVLLTTRCNLRCRMCGVWKTQEEELETYYVKKLIDDAAAMGNLQEVYFTGGEALLRQDIFSLIKYVNDHYPDLWITVNTNGALLTRKMIDRIIDSRLKALGISIDSPVAAVHDSLRGEGVFAKVIEAIEYINAEKKRRGSEYPLLDTCSVLMDQTLDTIEGMLDFCSKYRFSGLHVQPYVCNSDLRGAREDALWIKGERLKKLRETVTRMEARKKDYPGLFVEVPAEKICKYFSEPTYVDNCYAGFTRAIVVGKKICFVCNGPNDYPRQHFGEADKESIRDVWYSREADGFRNSIKGCTRNCVQFCSIRPSADSREAIHKRLADTGNPFLLEKELEFLTECAAKYPALGLGKFVASCRASAKGSGGFIILKS